jgi:hypothetical protein
MANHDFSQLTQREGELLVRIDALERAGDRMAHELSMRQAQYVLAPWWRLRGNKCTVCDV